jgi:hypothetical protein
MVLLTRRLALGSVSESRSMVHRSSTRFRDGSFTTRQQALHRSSRLARGEVEAAEDGVLVLRRVHVALTLKDVSPDKVEAARRAHDGFKTKCPVYRSLHTAVDITTELSLVEATP